MKDLSGSWALCARANSTPAEWGKNFINKISIFGDIRGEMSIQEAMSLCRAGPMFFMEQFQDTCYPLTLYILLHLA